jgi:hypothetical protein
MIILNEDISYTRTDFNQWNFLNHHTAEFSKMTCPRNRFTAKRQISN